MSDAECKTTYRLVVGIEEIESVDGRANKPEEVSTIEVKDSECSSFDAIKAAQIELSGQTMEVINEPTED